MKKEYEVLNTFKCGGQKMVTVKIQSTGACCVMSEEELDRIIWNDTKNNRQKLLGEA